MCNSSYKLKIWMYCCGYKHYYTVMTLNIKVASHQQNVGQAIISFENTIQIKYFRIPTTNENHITWKSRLMKSLLQFSSKFVRYLSIMSVFPKHCSLTILASNNNQTSPHPCSCKYSVQIIDIQNYNFITQN
jgi:hypothetical protein